MQPLTQIFGHALPLRIERVLENIFGFSELFHLYESIRHSASSLVDSLLEELDISVVIAPADLSHIPARGATVILSNHPFGLLDGAILVSAVRKLRLDVKVLANDALCAIPELRELVIPVDVLGRGLNTRGVRSAVRHLRAGGLLIAFPSGEVARKRDAPWNPSLSRLLTLADGITVVPAHVRGSNSVPFRVASAVHTRLGTAMLARELLNKRGRTVDVRFGRAVSAARLSEFSTHGDRMDYLRWRTELLDRRQKYKVRTRARVFGRSRSPRVYQNVAEPVSIPALRAEVEALEGLCSAGTLTAYIAPARKIPSVLREIARLREVTFRAVGEGTGEAVDTDTFDHHYLHLFLWNHQTDEVVGAYRLAVTDDGPSALYTATLFRYGQNFLDELGPAIELGRSFVRVEYQRSFTPLLLLWKGISRYVQCNPRYKVLFGPVSISNSYSPISRQLIASFLEQRSFLTGLARLVSARNPFRIMERAADRVRDVDDLSDAVADLEGTGPGIPVLLRQYLQLGGKLVGFGVDPSFGDTLDGLIVVDLTCTSRKLLDRYFGKAEAEQFLSFHRGQHASNTKHRDSELDTARNCGSHPVTNSLF